MFTLGERLDWCPDLGSETDGEVAWVVDGSGGNLDLLAWFEGIAVRRQFVEAGRFQLDPVDGQPGLVALDEVDEDLALLQHLVVRARSHGFDAGGKPLGLTARDTGPEPQNHDGEARGDSCADEEILLVYGAFHELILAEKGPRHTCPGVTG